MLKRQKMLRALAHIFYRKKRWRYCCVICGKTPSA